MIFLLLVSIVHWDHFSYVILSYLLEEKGSEERYL